MADKVVLENINAVYVRIHCEPALLAELSEHFTFEVPGARFSPSFQNHHWDGKIRLIKKGTTYRGLHEEIKEFCDDRGYEFEYNRGTHRITDEEIQHYFDEINIKEYREPRDYQIDAFRHGLENEHALFLSATGSGKSLIIYLLTRYYIEKLSDQKALIIVPNLGLIAQMESDFRKYSINGALMDSVHLIYSGQEKKTDCRIVISTWQSIYKMPTKFFEQFGFVLADECHGVKADSLKGILEKCTNTEYRFGTTGTLDGTKCNPLVIAGLTGPVVNVATTRELIDKGLLANLNIKCIALKYDEQTCKEVCKLTYQEEIGAIITHKKRQKFIRNLALSLKGNTLILFQYVAKHGVGIHEDITKRCEELGDDRKVFFVFGGTDMENREKVRSLTENETNAIIVASIQVFSVGINIENIDNLIFATPSKSRIRVLQSIGRCLRVGRTGEATLYDIVDDFSTKRKKNFAVKHFVERIKYYTSEQLPYSINKVNIPL